MAKLTDSKAYQILDEAGATRGWQEDRFGETKYGWWLDGVYLGKTVTEAARAITG